MFCVMCVLVTDGSGEKVEFAEGGGGVVAEIVMLIKGGGQGSRMFEEQ